MPTTTESNTTDIVLPVAGMTCASCVRRIEKALKKVDGVQQASVNLATEKAHVVFDPAQTGVEQMRAAVEKAGYSVTEIAQPMPAVATGVDPGATAEDIQEIERQREIDDLKRKWSLSLVAGLLMMALSFIPLNVP